MLPEYVNDFCPSCGTEASLNSVSGFCVPCTKRRFPDKAVCDNCGRVEARGQFRSKCQYCQEKEWFDQNANKIESYMAAGLTFAMAFAKVLFDNRPSCYSCGTKIKGGTRGRHFFCRTSELCNSAGIKFHRLKGKGLTTDEALKETARWLHDRRSKQVA